MARASTVKRLPPEIRARIASLRDQGCTIDEILAKLRELDVGVSRSALGRYTKEIEEVGEKIRQSREVAQALVAKLGDEPEGKTARLNIELAHSLVLKAMMDGESFEPGDLRFLSDALYRLTAANKLDADRIIAIQTKVLSAAAKAAESEAKARGMSRDTVQAIKAKILGVQV